MNIAVNALIAVLLLIIGAVGGVWITSKSYRPLLDAANTELATATAGRDNLEALTTEQGRALGNLMQLGNERAKAAELAQEQANTEAKTHEEAANRLLSERIGGDDCAAATVVIDQELFGI